MKKLILSLTTVLFLFSLVYAEDDKIAVTTKQGNVYHWKSYYEKDGNVCTQKSYGEMCLPKSEIKHIAKADKTSNVSLPAERKDETKKAIQETAPEEMAVMASTSTKTEGKTKSPIVVNVKSVQWKWGDDSAMQKYKMEQQRIQQQNQQMNSELNSKAKSMGLGTVK